MKQPTIGPDPYPLTFWRGVAYGLVFNIPLWVLLLEKTPHRRALPMKQPTIGPEPCPPAFWRGVACGFLLSIPLWILLYIGITSVSALVQTWWVTP